MAKTKRKRQAGAKKLLEEMKENSGDLFREIADIVTLSRECGVTSYRLTGSSQEPIITNYSVF